MMMHREISQSEDLVRKKRKWEELPSLMEMIFLEFSNIFCFVCFSPFCLCMSCPPVFLHSFSTADFSAMHHGTINR